MLKLSKILVPVDFSECSRAALEYAAFLADGFGASIDLLHVWEPPYYVVPEMLVYLPGDAEKSLAEFAQTQATKQMDEFVASVRSSLDFEVKRWYETGAPADTILKTAHEGAHDLIVMGTHGRTGLQHLLMGSVTERVVRRAAVPVLTVHSHGKAKAAAAAEKKER